MPKQYVYHATFTYTTNNLQPKFLKHNPKIEKAQSDILVTKTEIMPNKKDTLGHNKKFLSEFGYFIPNISITKQYYILYQYVKARKEACHIASASRPSSCLVTNLVAQLT